MSDRSRTCPYVGLVPYSEDDWEYFFGRDTETELIIANLVASRLTLLFGASGVGKSSVLRAGVAHRLMDQARQAREASDVPEVAVAVFSAWRDDPMTGLTRAMAAGVARALGRDPDPRHSEGPLADACAAWTDMVGGEITVVLDQFEEYFLYHGREDGEGTFAVEFPRLVNRQDLRVNFLISIREDAVARLDRFKGRLPGLFDNYLRLRHLDLVAAEQAIRKPLDAYNLRHPEGRVKVDPALVQEVLRQTRTDQVRAGRGLPGAADAGEHAAEIETPYLQMVMTRLWDEEMRRDSRTLQLATFIDEPPRGLGGADRIIRTHLDGEMATLTDTERDVAAEAFRFLVTRTGTKIALAVDDLAGYTPLTPERLAPVLEKLAAGSRRILRTVPVPDHPETTRYEIFHDVLGQAITDWRRRHEAIKEQETIRREQDSRQLEELKAAEDKRLRERSRYMKVGLLVLSIGFVVLLGVSVTAWHLRTEALQESKRANEAVAKARFALAQAERNARDVESTVRAASEARSVEASKVEPNRAAVGSQLRDAFLDGSTEKTATTARRLGLLNEQVRFVGQQAPQNYRIKEGQVYEYSMRPVPESVPGGLRTLAAVTFKMNHPTFSDKVLVGDPALGFRAGYIGWGCLREVPVLLEYVDPRRLPEVAVFPMCDNTEVVTR